MSGSQCRGGHAWSSVLQRTTSEIPHWDPDGRAGLAMPRVVEPLAVLGEGVNIRTVQLLQEGRAVFGGCRNLQHEMQTPLLETAGVHGQDQGPRGHSDPDRGPHRGVTGGQPAC